MSLAGFGPDGARVLAAVLTLDAGKAEGCEGCLACELAREIIREAKHGD